MTSEPTPTAIGPGLPITEIVRFVTVAGDICRLGFEHIGRRATSAESAADRLALAEASRTIGATLETWTGLGPDAVGLRALAASVAEDLATHPDRARLVAFLDTGDARTVAAGLVAAVGDGCQALVAVASPIADRALLAGVSVVRVHLLAAANVLAGDGVDGIEPTNGAYPCVEQLLNEGRKSFSSSLSVSKGNGSSHEPWQ